jgi:hypothetical protein
MNDVVKTARKAIRDANRRDKEDERRRQLDDMKEAEASKKKRARMQATVAVVESISNPSSRTGSRPSTRDGKTVSRGGVETVGIGVGGGYGLNDDEWKADVVRLKQTMSAFDVSTDGLRVTWHGKPRDAAASAAATAAVATGLPQLGSRTTSTNGPTVTPRAGSPSKPSRATFPKLQPGVPTGGGMGALAAASDAVAAKVASKRKDDLGFDCHAK